MKDAYAEGLFSKAFTGKYDFVGFSVYTGFHKPMFRKADVFREEGFKVIMGGPHATYFSEECRRHSDFVVVGEGLRSVKSIASGEMTDGLAFLPGLVPANKIPIPDRDSLYEASPGHLENPIKNVMTSFGCPFTCSYCFNDSYKKLYGDHFSIRQRSVDSVIEECQQIKSKYPLDLIYFQDDCFGLDMKWLEDFVPKYKRAVALPFHAQVRSEMINDDRLKLFKEAGCHGITMAVECFREDIRKKLLNRNMTNESIKRSCSMIKESGMKLRTEQMLGLPETSLADELDLLSFNMDLDPEIAWASIYSPYLGTRLGDACKQEGIYEGNNDDLADSFFSSTRLNFDPARKRRTNALQKMFSTCAKLPKGDLLAKKFFNESPELNFDTWFDQVRKHLYDNYLYKI
uniref:Putative radical SAM superfamily protein n=1 Tax=viral metagenome TaxID=1070528 RepID=A0A6M3K447_9ZZZZ